MSELKKAIEDQDVDLVERLLSSGVDVNELYSYQNTPLHIAATFSDSESARKILSLLVDAGACLSAVNENGDTPLEISMNHNGDKFVGFFITAEVNQKTGTHNDRKIYACGNVTKLKKGMPVKIDLDDYLDHQEIYSKGIRTMYCATGVEHPYEIYQYLQIVYPSNDGSGGWTVKWFNSFWEPEQLSKVKKILKLGGIDE